MNVYESPSPRAGDEDRYEDHTPALCDVCGNRPGEVAQDGDWVCARCDAALEAAALAVAAEKDTAQGGNINTEGEGTR